MVGAISEDAIAFLDDLETVGRLDDAFATRVPWRNGEARLPRPYMPVLVKAQLHPRPAVVDPALTCEIRAQHRIAESAPDVGKGPCRFGEARVVLPDAAPPSKNSRLSHLHAS